MCISASFEALGNQGLAHTFQLCRLRKGNIQETCHTFQWHSLAPFLEESPILMVLWWFSLYDMAAKPGSCLRSVNKFMDQNLAPSLTPHLPCFPSIQITNSKGDTRGTYCHKNHSLTLQHLLLPTKSRPMCHLADLFSSSSGTTYGV